MKVFFHEIKDEALNYSLTEDTPWVMEVIGALDERIDRIKRPPNWKPPSRPTQVEFTLRRVDDLIHVSGKVKTQLYMLCSLCADAFQFPVNIQFHTLLTQSEVYADAPRETSHKGNFEKDNIDGGWEMDEEDEEDDELDEPPALNLNASDFEVTIVKEPVADLKEILNEQIVLTLPMQPKPAKDEDENCVKCGKSQLAFTESAQEPLKENPFSVLKDLKKK